MKEKNRKPLIFILLLVFVGIVVAGTFAYYTSSDTFNNEFDAGKYKIETQEAFVSPENWTPGTTTPKTFSVTNKGTVDAAVKVCFTQNWVDANNQPLDLKDSHDNLAAVLNFASNSNKNWLEDCSNNGTTKYCFYYYKKLEPNETTTNLLESVTYNGAVDINTTRNCTTENGVTTCTTNATGYAGAKYTLNVNIETVQYDQYQNVFTNVTARKNGVCSALNIQEEGPPKYKVDYLITDYIFIKDDELDNYDLTNAMCDVEYVGEHIEANKYNRCDRAILHTNSTYEEGEQVEVPVLTVRYSYGEWDSTLEKTVFNHFDDMYISMWAYEKNEIEQYGYTYNDDDDEVMNFQDIVRENWDDTYGYITTGSPTSFTMPNHDVLVSGTLANY
jgi:alternate signal-mediated exported protein